MQNHLYRPTSAYQGRLPLVVIFIDRDPSSAVKTNHVRPALAGDGTGLLIGLECRSDRPETPGTKKAF